jgi:molybdate-binding protein/DNA-binding XRE family transcriptional regulator
MDRLSTTLREARTAAGMSQAALADATAISRQAYAAIERGASTPGTDVALRLAAALRTTVESLFSLGAGPTVRATLTAPVPEGPPVRAQVHRVGERWVARPLGGSPAHPAITRTLPVANAWVRRSPGTTPSTYEAELLEPPFANSLVAVGCDPSMSVVAAHLRGRGVELAWREMGSAAALRELALGNAHVAGCHLRDPETGQYNLPWVERLLPFPATVVTFAVWDQGLVVAPSNPKQIRGIEDLARAGVLMVNREKGSGSRALLDDLLAAAHIAPAGVAGYGREATSHLSVAEAVGMGLADAGVAVRAAAIALGLDFVPLSKERYDLVIPTHFLGHAPVAELLAALRRQSLRRQVEALGGYDVATMGTEPAAA